MAKNKPRVGRFVSLRSSLTHLDMVRLLVSMVV